MTYICKEDTIAIGTWQIRRRNSPLKYFLLLEWDMSAYLNHNYHKIADLRFTVNVSIQVSDKSCIAFITKRVLLALVYFQYIPQNYQIYNQSDHFFSFKTMVNSILSLISHCIIFSCLTFCYLLFFCVVDSIWIETP